jgi:hypothetical protein
MYLKLLVPEKIVWTQNNFLSAMPAELYGDE